MTNALIIGVGICGLAASLSLNAAGIDAEVFESGREPSPSGFGINLQPNAVRQLTELCLAEDVGANRIPTAELACYNKHGQLIWSEPGGKTAGYS